MIPFLQIIKGTALRAVLDAFITDCGFTVEDVTSLKFYAETTRDREAEVQAGGGDVRCFKATGNSMYILTFENGAQHCKYINGEMLATQDKIWAAQKVAG